MQSLSNRKPKKTEASSSPGGEDKSQARTPSYGGMWQLCADAAAIVLVPRREARGAYGRSLFGRLSVRLPGRPGCGNERKGSGDHHTTQVQQ